MQYHNQSPQPNISPAPRCYAIYVLPFVLLLSSACSDGILSKPTSGKLWMDGAPLSKQKDGSHEGFNLLDSGAPSEKGTTPVGCGEFLDKAQFTCSKDGNSRGKCIDNQATVETCQRGCLKRSGQEEDICLKTSSPWSCPGFTGEEKAEDGDYFITSFGCWVDPNGTAHGDSGDNCIPACIDKIKSSGFCQSSWSGKTCEEKTNWYTADSTRFGCLAHLRITNPANNKSVIAVVFDAGPNCSVERSAQKAVLDVSSAVTNYLFGGSVGWSDRRLVHVVEVADDTPLGPVN